MKQLIREGRCVGNTTRIIDAAIQELFDKRTVVIEDHFERGHQQTFNKVLKRLQCEHKGLDYRIYEKERRITLG